MPETAGTTSQKGTARFIGDVPGCFVFLDRTGPGWEAQTFAFSARSVAATRAVVSTDIDVERNERVALRFDTIGVRRGVVERRLKGGFIVAFTDDVAGEGAVEARIQWLNRKSRGRAEDRRMHKRVTPRERNVLVILGTDSRLEARMLDVSRSGAAILSAVQPPIGNLLAVGAVPARVVRHFEGGFAVRFLDVQEEADLEGLLTLRTRQEKTLAARKLGFAAQKTTV